MRLAQNFPPKNASGAVARIYAGILGLLALVTTVARAVIHGGSLPEALWTGCGWLMVFALIGAVVGKLAQHAIDESVAVRLATELAASNPPDAISGETLTE